MTHIPATIAAGIRALTEDRIPADWPAYLDRDTDVWHLTNLEHDGDHIMLPSAGDMPLMLARDVERLYGPLTRNEAG